jgi:hypothetical protein
MLSCQEIRKLANTGVFERWGGRRGLNPRHSVPQTDALPAELLPPLDFSLTRNPVAGTVRLELRICPFANSWRLGNDAFSPGFARNHAC